MAYKLQLPRVPKRGRPCQVCTAPNRTEVELFMARGGSRDRAAERFPDLGSDAIGRHWKLHVPDHVKAAAKIEILKPGAELEQIVNQESIGLLAHLQRIRSVLYKAFDKAAERGDAHEISALSAQLHSNLKISAQKTGELQQHSATTINNLVLSPDYLNLRAALISVLRPHPAAARAVADAFRQVESGHDVVPGAREALEMISGPDEDACARAACSGPEIIDFDALDAEDEDDASEASERAANA